MPPETGADAGRHCEMRFLYDRRMVRGIVDTVRGVMRHVMLTAKVRSNALEALGFVKP